LHGAISSPQPKLQSFFEKNAVLLLEGNKIAHNMNAFA
jgi:hypothetical protein